MRLANTNKSGDRAELVAAIWLLDHGYEVFRNVSCAGPADLIAWKPRNGVIVLIDVKSHVSASCMTLADGSKSVPVSKSKHPRVHCLHIRDGVVMGFLRRNKDGERERYWPDLEPQF